MYSSIITLLAGLSGFLACVKMQGLPTGLSGLSAPGLNGEYCYEIESGCSQECLVWLIMMYVAVCKVSTGFLACLLCG